MYRCGASKQPESTDKEVKMRFRSINTGFRAICTFHPFGESENRRKLPKVRSILSQTDFAIFLSVDSGKQLAPHHIKVLVQLSPSNRGSLI
jgi:hypothetical protein